jgi:hypothetical protein
MAYAFLTHAKPFSPLGLVRIGIFSNISRQHNPVDLCSWLISRALWFNPLQPPHHRRYAYAKPSRYLGYCKVFLLSNSQYLTAEIQ